MKTLNLLPFVIAIVISVLEVNAQIKASPPPPPPPEFSGVFSFDPAAIEITAAKHELTIFTVNSQSLDFVKSLRKQNYACLNFDSRHVKCSKFMDDLDSIDSNFSKVKEKYSNAQLEIFEGTGPVELINDAEMLTEWKKVQNAKWMGQKFTELYYSELKNQGRPDLTKLKFINERGDQAYFYLAGHAIAFQHVERIDLNPNYDFVLGEVLNCVLEIKLHKD
jgi:hypothetical protein